MYMLRVCMSHNNDYNNHNNHNLLLLHIYICITVKPSRQLEAHRYVDGC